MVLIEDLVTIKWELQYLILMVVQTLINLLENIKVTLLVYLFMVKNILKIIIISYLV